MSEQRARSPRSFGSLTGVRSSGVSPTTEGRVEMRASHLRSNLEEINRMPEPQRSEIRARIAPSVLEQVANSTSVAWLPIESDMDITRAVVAVLGREGNRVWSRDALLRSATGPLLKPIFDGARSVFGVSPHALYKIVPRGFTLVYRGMGDVNYELVGPQHARLVQSDLPAVMLDAVWYLDGIAGAFEAGFAIFGASGEVTLSVDPVKRIATYDAQWQDPP